MKIINLIQLVSFTCEGRNKFLVFEGTTPIAIEVSMYKCSVPFSFFFLGTSCVHKQYKEERNREKEMQETQKKNKEKKWPQEKKKIVDFSYF
jgi:hypothetical protein